MSQSSKGRKEIPGTDLENFEFDPTGLNTKWSKNLISVFDGYRIHRCYDLTFIEKAISRGELPKNFIKQWGTIRLLLHKFAAVGPNVPGVQKLMTHRQIVNLLSTVLLTIAFPLVILVWVFHIEFLSSFTTPFTVVTLLLFLAAFISSAAYNRRVAWVIYHYIEENGAMFDTERGYLKKWVQTLISYLARIIRREQTDPKKNLVKFWNDDYVGITVLKGPNKFRKHYVMELKD
jgi:hypothetical protein